MNRAARATGAIHCWKNSEAAFGVPTIISGEAVAAAAAGKWMKKSFAFGQFAQAQVEQATPLAVDENDAQAGECSQQLGQGFQIEMPVQQKLCAAELGRKIILTTEDLCRGR